MKKDQAKEVSKQNQVKEVSKQDAEEQLKAEIKAKEILLKQYYKRFVRGEQNITFNESMLAVKSAVISVEKTYYWQENKVYNILLPAIKQLKANYGEKITEDFLYGKNGLIPILIPLQQSYNTVMNKYMECVNKVATNTVLVEDGSVDIDALEEDGLAPGKILVYRQGAPKPTTLGNVTQEEIQLYSIVRQALLSQFDTTIKAYTTQFKEKQ